MVLSGAQILSGTKYVDLKQKVSQLFLQQNWLIWDTKEFQPRTCKYGKPHENPLKQSGNYFIEWKRKLEQAGEAITKQKVLPVVFHD